MLQAPVPQDVSCQSAAGSVSSNVQLPSPVMVFKKFQNNMHVTTRPTHTIVVCLIRTLCTNCPRFRYFGNSIYKPSSSMNGI